MAYEAVAEAIAYAAEVVATDAYGIAEAVGLSETAAAYVAAFVEIGVTTAAYVGISALGATALPSAEQGSITIKQPNPPRRFAYGIVRLAGSGYLLWTGGGNWAGQVHPLCEGPVDSFGQFYLFDKKVNVEGDGSVTPPGDGTYPPGFVKIYTRTGLFTETAYSEVIAKFPDEWTADHRGDGIATLAMLAGHGNAKDFPTRYPGGEPQPSVVVKASLIYDPRDPGQDPADRSTWIWSDNPVLCLLHLEMVHERRCYTDGFDGDAKAILIWKQSGWDRYFAPTIEMWKGAADISDEPIRVANATAFLSADAAVGADHVTLESVPGISAGTVITIGSDVVTASGVAGNVVTFTPNLTAKHVKGETAGWAIDPGTTVSVKRYTCGGFWNASNALDSIRQALLASMDGWSSQRGDGALTVYAGKLYTPTVTLTDDDILGYECQRFVQDESAVNQVVASYTEPGIDYVTAECQPWRDEEDILATGKERTENLPLTWVQNNSQARRLAKRRLSVVNPPAQGSLTCDMTDNVLEALGQRYVQIQCSSSPTMADLFVQLTGAEIDLMGMTITFNWFAADPDIDEWNYAAEEGALPFSASRGAGEETPTPTSVTGTPEFETISTGGQGVRIRVDFDAPSRDDLTYVVQWKRSTETSWNTETFTDADDLGSTFELLTGFVPVDATLDLQLQFISGGGRPGNWSTTATVDTSSALVAPSKPTAVSAANGSGHSLVSWINPPSSNLDYLQVFRGTTTVFGSAVAVSGHLTPTGLSAPQTWDNTGLSAGTKYFWVVAYNAADVASVAAGPDSAVVT